MFAIGCRVRHVDARRHRILHCLCHGAIQRHRPRSGR
jgi:hypothetical protein